MPEYNSCSRQKNIPQRLGQPLRTGSSRPLNMGLSTGSAFPNAYQNGAERQARFMRRQRAVEGTIIHILRGVPLSENAATFVNVEGQSFIDEVSQRLRHNSKVLLSEVSPQGMRLVKLEDTALEALRNHLLGGQAVPEVFISDQTFPE